MGVGNIHFGHGLRAVQKGKKKETRRKTERLKESFV